MDPPERRKKERRGGSGSQQSAPSRRVHHPDRNDGADHYPSGSRSQSSYNRNQFIEQYQEDGNGSHGRQPQQQMQMQQQMMHQPQQHHNRPPQQQYSHDPYSDVDSQASHHHHMNSRLRRGGRGGGDGGEYQTSSSQRGYDYTQPSPPNSASWGDGTTLGSHDVSQSNSNSRTRGGSNANYPPASLPAFTHHQNEVGNYMEIQNVPLEDNNNNNFRSRNNEGSSSSRNSRSSRSGYRHSVMQDDAVVAGEDNASSTSRASSRNSAERRRGPVPVVGSVHHDDHSNSLSNLTESLENRMNIRDLLGVSRWGRRRSDENVGGGGASGTAPLRSNPSNNSLRRHGRRGGRGSDYSIDGTTEEDNDNDDDDDDDDDSYMVGRGPSISSHSTSRGRLRSGHSSRGQMSDDASYASSYGGILDDESKDGRGNGGNGGNGDVWSINKSVFSTLPDRLSRGSRNRGGGDGGSLYDDDDASLFSTASSYSRQRTASRSSSVASRMSQGSQQSSQMTTPSASSNSFRLPKQFRGRNSTTTYEYDSDDSIGSLMGGVLPPDAIHRSSVSSTVTGGSTGGNSSHVSDASSGSFLFDRKEVKDDKMLELPPTSKEKMTADFGDTLSHLQSLGFGIGLGEDEDVGSDGDDEASVRKRARRKLTSKEKDDDTSAWWIKDLENEGWFQHDTSTVYSSMVPTPKNRRQVVDAATDELNEDELADSTREFSGAIVDSSQADAQLDDDSSDTSTIGIQDAEELQDWEERLWSLARAHYLEYSGREADDGGIESISHIALMEKSIATSVTGTMIDEQSVKDQESFYLQDYEVEQKSVLLFRSLLLKCIEVYVNAFHRQIGEKELKVYRYIPLTTARNLFLEVIEMMDDGGGNSNAFDGLDGTSQGMSQAISHVTLSMEKRAEIITSILVDDELNIFRRYQVITLKTSTSKMIGGKNANRKSRKRLLSKGLNKSSGDAQAELEEYLYGEMNNDCENEEERQQQGDNDAPEVLETKEHEIRIRSDVIQMVLNSDASKQPNTITEDYGEESTNINPSCCWANSAICKVLLSNIQTITKKSNAEGQADQEEDTQISARTPAAQSDQQPIAQLYSLRYSPIFLLKALTTSYSLGMSTTAISSSVLPSDPDDSSSLQSCKGMCKDLTNLLFDESYLVKRFELQGPYDATITHLSNWQSAFSFQKSNLEKCKQRDADGESTSVLQHLLGSEHGYGNCVALIVSTLYSHLNTTLVHTGYQGSKQATKSDEDNTPEGGEKETDEEWITTQNYANIVANCLEIGRALHHLGVCLGRRQRDIANNMSEEDSLQNNNGDESKAADGADNSTAVNLEITSYKNALDAYKGAIYVLSKAEDDAVSNAAKALENKRRLQKVIHGELQMQEREAPSTHRRDTSEARDMAPSDELQEIREAKISVELHLADTLNCLGYVHDSKLSEYDKSLMAYRESLSLYIRHVGRFHKMVSNALHNMGAIHVELGQFREAASCFRQCLAILKRREEKQRVGRLQQGQQHDDEVTTTPSSSGHESQQMFVTLQCLGNSLAELGEYDASIACFQEIINASSSETKNKAEGQPTSTSTIPDSFTGEVLSQMARCHVNQASKLSRAFNWQCHLLLFSDRGEGNKREDPGLMLARRLHLERNGKDCIIKSIHSRRNICYDASVMTKEAIKPSDGGDIFSSLDNGGGEGSSQFSRNAEGGELTFHVSVDAPPVQLGALAKDLLTAGRLEFRSRSYQAALSHCWESLLLTGLLIAQRSNAVEIADKICDLLVFDDGFLKTEGKLFQVVPDKVFSVIELVDIPSAMDSTGIEFIQLLFLIGVSYTRVQDFDKAMSVLRRAQTLLDPERLSSGTTREVKGTLDEAVFQLDIAHLYLRIGSVKSELGNFESAASSYKEAASVFNSTATHPAFASESKVNRDSELNELDVVNRNKTEWQHKELEIVLKNGLACSLHRLGQTYTEQKKSEKAMKCFEDTARILNEIHDARVGYPNWKTVPSVPFASRCFWEEVSAISTSMNLSDANERSGRISMDDGSDHFSLQCFERAIGMREFILTTVGSLSSNVDSECSLERFEESKSDARNMDCYSAMLLLIEKREVEKDRKLTGGEEKSWKMYHKLGLDGDLDSENAESMQNDDSMLTKEDILFRIGNLQVKSGRFRDAINSYKEAEELTVEKLGTKDHAIVMNILHNMGNAYRSISLSSCSESRVGAKEEAFECYTEAIRISQAFFGKQHVTSAESMQSLGVLYMNASNACLAISNEENRDTNDDEFAFKSFKESLSIRRRENGSQNDLETAFILKNLGDLCVRKVAIGEYFPCDDSETLKFVDDAMNFLSESLKIRKMFLAQDHINIGDTYQSIGIAHLNRALALKNDANKMDSEISKAFKALTSSLAIRRAFSSTFAKPSDGSKSSDEYRDSILMEAHCLFYLGRVEEIRSNHDEAKSHLIDALRLFQTEGKQRLSRINAKEVDHVVDLEGKLLMDLEAINLWAARVLYHMASIHKVAGSIEDSISCYEEALRIRSQCKSPKKHGLNNALIYVALAKVRHENQNYDKSIECYSQSLRTYLAHFGKDSMDVADTLTGMGNSFAMKSSFDKTMQCYDKAMRVYEYREGMALKEKKGLLHREIAYTVQRLDGDIFEVLEHYRSSVSFLEEFNERHRMAVGVRGKSDHEELNRRLLLYYSEMLTILRQVLDIERDRNIKAELCDEIGDVLHRMGNLHATFAQYDEAMDCFTEVLETQRIANNDLLRIADLLFNMGNIHLEQGLPEKSLDSLRESYDITREALGEENKELHSTMYLMSVAMTNLNDYESASKWLKRALSVLKSNNDEEIVDEAARGKTLHQMGKVYEKTGDQAKAVSCFQESVQILKMVQGDDLELSNALNSMGNLLRNVSDFEQSLDCYDQSLTLRTGLGDELIIANTKNNIGAVLSAMEDLDRAMAFSAEALRIKTERLGSDCVETARALVNMGQLYLDQKLYTNAEHYFQRGLRIFRVKMEKDHPDIAMCIHKLGVIKEALSKDERALDYYLQSVYVFKNIGASEKNVTLAFSLHNAALIYTRQKEFITALDCMTEALDTKTAALGATHSETAASQHYLGTIYLELEDSEAALFHFKGALKIRVECFGTENLDVAVTLYGLATAHFMRDEFEESIDCLIENLRVLRKFACDEEEVSKAELLLGSSYQELGQFDTAKDHLLESLHMLVSAHGVNHLDVAQALFRLGICFCETNEYSVSLEKFKECLEIRATLLGNLHIECANTYESIGIVQQKTECHEDAIHSFERALAIKRTSLEENDEDFCVLLHFIGSSLFELERYDDAVGYFSESAERKKNHYGRTDEDYANSVIDLAAAYAKIGDEHRSMECYREAIESGGLSSDSWELGVAHKCLAGYFFNQHMNAASLESYYEATSIFEWNINNVEGSQAKHDDVIQCYEPILTLEDEPLSDVRADLCYKLANGYVQVNKQEDAVLMYREAIMIQSQLHGTDHLSVANSLHNLGNCYRDLSEFDKSAECLTKSLTLSTMNFEDENEEVADTCHCLAMTLMSTCELDEASSLFERALAIRKKKLGSLDLNVASTLYNLSMIFQMRGSWTNAIKHCKEALRIQRMTVGDDSPITASTLECIGRIHMDKREFENALQCFSKCILQGKSKLQRECGIIYQFRGESFKARKMLIKAGLHAAQQLGLSASESGELDLLHLTRKFQDRKRETSDRDLLRYAENIMFYGSILMNIKKFNEALECFRFSNIIFQAKYGSDHLTIAENLHQTGVILEKTSDLPNNQQQLVEALELTAEALRIRQLYLVESHPDLEETLLCLGRVHHKLGNIHDALNFLTDAVKARDARVGKKHARMDDADALLEVGQLQQQSGQFRHALDSFEQCLDIRRQILGSDHPSIGELLFYIGNLFREVGDLDLAQMKFEESLAIAECEDPDSIETADTLFSLGVLYTEQKEFSLALDTYLGSLQIHKGRGSSNTAIAEILNNIGITYFEMKEFDRAQVYHAEALESLRQELGDHHDDVAFCWHSLGAVHQELSDQVEALKCFQHAVSIERTEMYLQSLGICLVKMNDNENAYVCLDEALRMKSLDCANDDADDDLAEIQRHLGIIWMRKKKFEDSLKCFEAALKIKNLCNNELEKDHMNLMDCLDGALDAVSELFGTQHMKYARLLHQKGNVHGANKEHALAIEAYVEALRIYKGEHGDSHLSVANTLFNLGVSLNAKGSPDKAIRCFTKALRITKARLGEDHLDVADTYEQVAESNKLMMKYDETARYYEKALYVRKQITGGSDVKSAAIMHELGGIHSKEGLWEDAERAFKESVRIRTIQLGQDDPLVAESMQSLGEVYKSRGENTKALKYLEGSLRICKSKHTSTDPKLADNFHSLGGVHSSLGSVDKSIFCYDKAMQMYTEVYGKNSNHVASSLAEKGEALRLDEQFHLALSCFSECLDIRKLVDGFAKESGDVLSKMGDIYSQLGDGTNASSSYTAALTTYRHIFGTRHQTVADVLQRMATHFIKVGELERGFSCVKEALALRQELIGQEDTETGDSHYCMGIILYEWNNHGEASKCFESACEIHKQNLGETHLSVANSNYYLGCISERKGNYESAVQCLQDSLVGRQEHLDEMDSEIAVTLARLGHVYSKQSEFDQAVTAFSDCLKIREAARGTDLASQIHVADALFDLGTALQKALDTQRSMQLFTDALKEYQRHLDDPNDAKIAKCHSCIGEIYEKTNELTEAVDALEIAKGIYESHVGADPTDKEIKASKKVEVYSGQAETLFRLATAKDRLGEEVIALKQYRKAMRLYKSLFGRDSLFVAKILNRLANMKGRAGSVDKAMVLFDESLRIRMLHLGNNHEDVAETLFGMGIVFEKRRDYSAAMKAYSDCLRIRSSKFGSDSMEVAQVVVNIGVVRGNKGDFSGALKSWNKALSIYRKHGLGDDDALVATVLRHQRLAKNLSAELNK